MRLLVEVKQADGQLRSFLQPLVNLPFVDDIHVVRDTPGPKMPKVTYHVAGTSGRWSRAWRKYRLLSSAARVVRPDIIVAVDVFPHFFNAFIVAKRRKLSLLLSLRGELENNPLRPNNVFLDGLINWMLRRTDIITTTGKDLRKKVIAKGVPASKVFFVPVAIDLDRFRPGKGKRCFDVISLGRLSPEKRIDRFVDAVALAKEKVPGIHAALVGSGPEEESLRARIREKGLERTIELLGFRDSAECWPMAKLYVLTSETEGLPQSLIEAFCCGVPAILPLIGDVGEVADERNAYIIRDKSDVAAYAQGMVSLLKDAAARKALSGHALEAREGFGFEAAEKVYRRIFKPWISQ